MNEAFDDSDDEIARVNCYAHVAMNMDKRAYNSEENKVQIQKDIRQLQVSYDKRTFDTGSSLLISKWQKDEAKFAEDFRDNYVLKNNGWYEGLIARTPSTNNACESFNQSLKQHQTHHNRKGLAEFLGKAIDYVQERSTEYKYTKDPPKTTIEINDELLEKGWAYSLSDKKIVSKTGANGCSEFFVFARGKMDKITLEDVRRFEDPNKRYKDFDDFVMKAFDMYKIVFKSAKDWQIATCTCGAYAKDFLCKHVVGIAFRLELLDPPESHRKKAEAPIAPKNKRGRPRKATPALIRD